MPSVDPNAAKPTLAQLKHWYGARHCLRVDIVGDFAGKELFAIHGESMVAHCIAAARVDYHGGFQLLHAVHAVEKLLADLQQRGCQFHVVWFSNHHQLCVPSNAVEADCAKYILTRNILIKHLDHRVSDSRPKVSFHFPCIESVEFKEYLAMNPLQFFLCSDGFPTSVTVVAKTDPTNVPTSVTVTAKPEATTGSQPAMKPEETNGSQPAIKPDATNGSQEDFNPERTTLCLDIILRLNTRGYSIALIDDIDISSSKVLVTVFSPSYNSKLLPGAEKHDTFEPSDDNYVHIEPTTEKHAILEPIDDNYVHIEPSAEKHAPLEPNDKNHEALLQSDNNHKALTESDKNHETLVPSAPGDVARDLLIDEKAGSWAKWDNGTPMSARETLSVAALTELAITYASNSQVATFITHLVLLKHLKLSHRQFPEVTPGDTQHLYFLRRFAEICAKVLDAFIVQEQHSLLDTVDWDIFDLVDGRVYHAISTHMKALAWSNGSASEARQLVEKIKVLSKSKIDCSGILQAPSILDEAPAVNRPHGGSRTVLKFNHPVFNELFKNVKLETSENPPQNHKFHIFREVSHWHNAKKTLSVKIKPKPLDWRAARKHQRFMASVQRYSQSLTGGAINPETIFVRESESSNDDVSKRPEWKKKLQQMAVAARKKASEKQAAAKKVTKSKPGQGKLQPAEKLSPSVQQWANKQKELDKEKDLKKRRSQAESFESDLKSHDATLIGPEVSLYICKTLAAMFDKTVAREKEPEPSAQYLVEKICERVMALKNKSLTQDFSTRLGDFAVAFQDATEKASSSNTFVDYQLEKYGPEMERGFDAAPDPRVPFQPDAWQRRVLDAIDAKKSLCVIAPTSAGKTFISFYAMKQVMQSSDDDVLVYVAPTKALVNQIAAEIQARFKKTFKHPESRSVWAIHTRDYRVNSPVGCSVLVTVPHILQIMLLAPQNAEKENSWSHRIKRIIFDEVHCIGQAEDGIVWEQLLLLAPCPIIALSATVGNPDEFKDWLAVTQKTKNYDLEMITHSARYSDLRKYFYGPQKTISESFQGFLPQDDKPRLHHGLDEYPESPFSFMHPIAGIMNRHRGTLDDISLEARDCLTLWRTMVKHQTEKYPVAKSLRPSKTMPAIVKKANVLHWEENLKECLLKWMVDLNSPFEAVRDDLRSQISFENEGIMHDLESHESPDTDSADTSSSNEPGEDVVASNPSTGTKTDQPKMYFQLLLDLYQKQALPAILFNYDRVECEETLRIVMAELERHEAIWKENSNDWSKKMSDYKKWQRSQPKPSKSATSKNAAQDEEVSKLDLMRESGEDEMESSWQSFNPEAPLERFSFGNSKLLSSSALEELIGSMYSPNLEPIFLDGLRRGCGVHHAGMPRPYRQLVEMLCRQGYLTVVIATGTLALGINVPCKTVVFAGDSVFLTALNYRQASGRAGRRGFDLLGNVVFNIPPQRALEIMSSRLPDLRGQFPVSTTLVLRLLTLNDQTNNGAFAARATRSLLSQTRLYLGGPAGEMAVKHHLRFSIEYLRRHGLLSEQGSPLNFSGLVSHLYFTENSAFAFHSLIRDGYFHELCAGFKDSTKAASDEVVKQLMLVLSHLFCRWPCSRSRDKSDKSSSIVILPDLPLKAQEVLRAHNSETLDIFKNYVHTFIDQHLYNVPDNTLPFTKTRVEDQAMDETQVPRIKDMALEPPKLRSPFTALSGFTDSFESIHDLCSTVRADVFLEESAVPYIPLYPDDTGGIPWNAYLYDFFRHGDMKALVRENDIKAGDVWFKLKDFSLILATIVASLTNFLSRKVGALDMTEIQDAVDKMEEDQLAEAEAAGEEAGETPDSVPDKTEDKKGQKKKVVDSWEDENSDDESDTEGAVSKEPPAESRHGSDSETLFNVLRAFSQLQVEFDTKFRKVWA